MKLKKKLEIKPIIVSIIPSIMFLLGLLFISFSPLTVSKLVTAQNDALTILVQEIKGGLSNSLYQAFSFIWSNILFPVVVFLLIVCIGFVMSVFFLEKTDFKIETISNIILIVVIYFVTRSVIIASTSVGLLIGSIWTYKTFEYRKNNFSTGYSFVSKRLKIMSLFLALGLFLVVFWNMNVYEKEIQESNIRMISSFLPNASALQDAQKGLVVQISGGFKSSITEEYRSMPSSERTECKSFYDNIIKDFDEFETKVTEQEGEGMMIEEMMGAFPAFDFMVKAAPLFTALTAYILLTILTPFVSILYGMVYSLLRKIRPKKD